MTPAFIGIDWGTTHRRAVLLSSTGEVLAEHADAEGAHACAGRFRPALEALLAHWPVAGADVPVVMAGMVGSATGWQSVPYLAAETPLAALAGALAPVADAPAGRRWFIVPGYCVRAATEDDGRDADVDVMRGEETQLLGASRLLEAPIPTPASTSISTSTSTSISDPTPAPAPDHPADGCYVLPGTHSKWVRLRAGHVVALRTYMTGELYAQVRAQGTLAGVMQGARGPVAADDPAFARGVRAMCADRPPALSHALFGVRARVVTGDLAPEAAPAYVSGLLIGAEWADARLRQAPEALVRVIGEPGLAALHAACAAHFERSVQALDVRAVQLEAWRALLNSGGFP
jgi:2-dehydro-3-deoxygalactonokinase